MIEIRAYVLKEARFVRALYQPDGAEVRGDFFRRNVGRPVLYRSVLCAE